MFKLPPIRYLVRDVLLAVYGFAAAITCYCNNTRNEINSNRGTLMAVSFLGGLLGTIIWCIRYYRSEPSTVWWIILFFGPLTFFALLLPSIP